MLDDFDIDLTEDDVAFDHMSIAEVGDYYRDQYQVSDAWRACMDADLDEFEDF